MRGHVFSAAFVVTVSALSFTLPACGPATPHCLPSNCAGCCTTDGVCQRGNTVKYCGHRGGTCSDCGSNGTCAEQQCIVLVPDGGESGGGEAGGTGGSSGGTAGGLAGGAGGSSGGSAGGTAGGRAGGSGGGTAGGTAGGVAGGGPVTGLVGEYFNSAEPLMVPPVTRTDANLNFDWAMASPVTGVGPDHWSARWRGQIQPQYTQTYTFYLRADDGCRLWVNGVPLIHNWVTGSVSELSATLALTAGNKYDLKVEYYDNTSNAVAQLSWSSASQPKQIVPASALFPPVLKTGGLWGDYYAYDDFTDYRGHRNDGPVSFDWTDTGPIPLHDFTNFYSTRWTGTVLPTVTGTYTFYTLSDDGVRLWVNGRVLVDNWTSHSSTENSGTIALIAGERAEVRLDYMQQDYDALIRLSWSAPGVAKAVIPAAALGN